MPNKPGNEDRTTTGGSTGSGRSRSNRGFASMDRSKQREIASKGGKAAHAKGTAHEFDSGEAREAGRKGGVAVSRNREHMAAIGRRGGEARGQSRNRTSGSVDSRFQNHPGGLESDREVSIGGHSDSSTADTQGSRNPSLGNERRASSAIPSRNETFR
ncbi:MAG TPA: KGG domain-containing protein [Vicinamibacterales bacterium]|nr:KGG domain-containing protein [Vicinamibacterales bacterium]